MANDTAADRTTIELEEAVEWYLTLASPDVSDEALNDWQAWLARSVSHREAFGEVQEIMQLSSHVASVPWPDESELLSDRYRGDVPIEEWQSKLDSEQQARTAQAQNRRHGGPAASGLWRFAAIVLLGIGLGFLGWAIAPDPTGDGTFAVHETAAAEHREIALSDGSVISLGARTLISVAYTDAHRRILLERGEAYFEVAKDRRRPFEVQAGSRIIRAVGTAFNVVRHSERVVIAVTEGVVVVEDDAMHIESAAATAAQVVDTESARVQAGQQFAYTGDSNEAIMPADPVAVTAWREGRLKFRNEPLHRVLEDVNRYSSRDIRLSDGAIGEMTFTGTVFQNNIDGWLASIEQAFPLKVRQTDDGGIVLMPTDDWKTEGQIPQDSR